MNKPANYLSFFLALCLFAASASPVRSATYRVVAYMTGGTYVEIAGITEGSPGLFYTTTVQPAIISVTSQGTLTTLATFNPPYGLSSYAVTAPNSLLYSSVSMGGNSGCCNLFSFDSTSGSEHIYPAENLLIALTGNLPAGNFLGISYNYATLATSLATADVAGNVTPLYQFPSSYIVFAPIYGADGNYYGTASPSRTSTSTSFYRVTPSGIFTQLATLPFVTTSFVGGGVVLHGSDGNFYGIQSTGLGCSSTNPHGGVYKLTPNGQFTLLHDFGVCSKGVVNSLIEGSDGKLYGATEANVLFSLTKAGAYKALFQATNGSTEGICPCWLLQGSDGILYGAAQGGGPQGDGLIFALDAGLPAPNPRAQRFSPKSGAVGTKVRIWGQNLFGATVTFNSAASTNVYNSGPNYVWATVPAGATTGPITITTPGGTSTTHASFTVN
jgi:hypothetical protein